MRSIGLAVLVALAAVPVGHAAAADKFSKALDDAKSAGESGETLKAAGLFGDALAIAQAADDLQSEQQAADAVVRFIDVAGERSAAKGAKSTEPTLRAVLGEILRKLDPARCGAYVSAPVLARNVLCLCTEDADFQEVADAAKAAAVHRSKAASGRAAPVVAKYADGLASVAAGAFDAAGEALDAAAADAIKSQWLGLATHVGTEAAAAWVHANKLHKAVATVTAVADAVGASASSRELTLDWNRFAAKRLADAPAHVRKPLDDLVAKHKGPGEARGGSSAGGRSTDRGASSVARLLSHLAKGKPFVSVQRAADGWHLGWLTKKSVPGTAPFDGALQTVNEGGVTLNLHERSVALRMIDYEGTAGVSGGGLSPVRAFYLLDEGETWSVGSDGVVSIARTK